VTKKSMLWAATAAIVLVLAACRTVFAGDAAAAGTMGDLLMSGGWGGGAWKGAVLGLMRALFGYWSKRPDDANERWDWAKFWAGGIAGASAGALAGGWGLNYDTAQGWMAQFGVTEAFYRAIQGIWRKYGVRLAAEAQVKAIEMRERRLAAPPKP